MRHNLAGRHDLHNRPIGPGWHHGGYNNFAHHGYYNHFGNYAHPWHHWWGWNSWGGLGNWFGGYWGGFNGARGWRADETVLDVKGRKGTNTLLLQVIDHGGAWAFSARVVDREGMPVFR